MADISQNLGISIDHSRELKSRERVEVSLDELGNGIRVSRPSTAGRYLRNLAAATQVLKWVRGSYNRQQWRALQQVLTQHAAGSLSEAQIKDVLSTYNTRDSLTLGKLQVVLDRFERARAGDVQAKNVLSSKPVRYSANQSWRAARSLTQKLHVKSGEREELHQFFRSQESHADRYVAGNARNARSVVTRGAKISGESVSQAIRQIERNHRALPNAPRPFAGTPTATNHGNPQEAIGNAILSRYQILKDEGAINYPVPQWYDGQFSVPPEDQKGLLTVPFGLIGKRLSTSEDHIVNLTIDFDQQKILYLDSKATPLDQLHKHYEAGDQVKPALVSLGRQYFGQQWSPDSGIVQLQAPKQLGANDCGPFTVEFAARLAQGESVADIERDFSPADRAKLRVNAGRLLRQYIEHQTASSQTPNEAPSTPQVSSSIPNSAGLDGFDVV